MRVLHVIPAVSARYGGPSQAVLDLSRALGPFPSESVMRHVARPIARHAARRFVAIAATLLLAVSALTR